MAELHSFFITTAKGMEEPLAQELRLLGASNVQAGRAGASFEGSLETAYRVCLGSRVGSRVLLPLKKFSAPTPEKLYGGVKGVRWSDHLSPKQTLAVDFTSSRSKITHTHFGALKTKDAICDQLRSTQGDRPSVDPVRPDVRVNVHVHDDEATVSIDLSGDSLHKRGYRALEEGAVAAPMKENLAAAILSCAGWADRAAGLPPAFLDPMCGSGTLPIEAGLIAAGIAPGLGRKHWGFTGWLGHVPRTWQRVLKEAEEARAQGLADKKKLPRIEGYDADFRVVRAALGGVERAGLRGVVHIEKRGLGEAKPLDSRGTFIVNPPYGERLGEVEGLKPLYKEIGDTLKKRFQGWEGYVFTGSPELAKCIGLHASRRFVLFNGPIECRLFKYELYAGSTSAKKVAAEEPVA